MTYLTTGVFHLAMMGLANRHCPHSTLAAIPGQDNDRACETGTPSLVDAPWPPISDSLAFYARACSSATGSADRSALGNLGECASSEETCPPTAFLRWEGQSGIQVRGEQGTGKVKCIFLQ